MVGEKEARIDPSLPRPLGKQFTGPTYDAKGRSIRLVNKLKHSPLARILLLFYGSGTKVSSKYEP